MDIYIYMYIYIFICLFIHRQFIYKGDTSKHAQGIDIVTYSYICIIFICICVCMVTRQFDIVLCLLLSSRLTGRQSVKRID